MTTRPAWQRAARTARGRPVAADELQFAAETSRRLARLGLPPRLDGFVAWRAYVALRAAWRVLRRPSSAS